MRPGRRLSVTLLVLAAVVAAAAAAWAVVAIRRSALFQTVNTHGARGGKPIPGAGAYVPAYDLSSDPVFPTLGTGYAIERHVTSAGVSEHLAMSDDGGASWYLAGSPFPFADGYSQVQFVSTRTGYAFGPAGLAVTHDGGERWTVVSTLGGTPERVVPVGPDVWATYTVCRGPPLPRASCHVELAMSDDGGRHWVHATGHPPLTEARSGGDILARVTLAKAYVVSYGATGGELALTVDNGRTWERLPDPCAGWPKADMAALSGGDLWMICGGPPELGGAASAKAVWRSFDGGLDWTLEAATGFGPELEGKEAAGGGSPVGRLSYAGQLGQLATIAPDSAWIGVSGVGVLVTFDYGKDWQVANGVTDAGHDTGVGVTFDNAYDGWAIEFDEAVWRTDDATHWLRIDPPAK